jgi:PAT family beta-lactamase induction signal transducer AmpG
MGTAGLVAGATGMVLAATVIERIGRLRTVMGANLLLVALHATAAADPSLLAVRSLFVGYVVATQVLDVTVAVAILTVFMGLCWQRVAATQFTIYLSLANLGYSSGAAVLGPLYERLPLPGVLLALAGLHLLAIAAVPFIDQGGHRSRLQTLDSGSSP